MKKIFPSKISIISNRFWRSGKNGDEMRVCANFLALRKTQNVQCRSGEACCGAVCDLKKSRKMAKMKLLKNLTNFREKARNDGNQG